jgi:PAS domain S-box-containing protein
MERREDEGDAETRGPLAEDAVAFGFFLDAAGDYLFVLDLDPEGTILDCNRTALVALSYWRGEIRGRSFLSLFEPRRAEEVRRLVLAHNAGVPLACTVPLLSKDGEPLFVETRSSRGAWRGRPVLYCVCRDMSERIRAEAQARIYVEEIEEKNAELAEAWRRIDDQVRKADLIHQLFLPDELPRVGGIDLVAWHQPAERLGGDFYQALRLPRGLLLYLVDVTGHGLDGALLSVFVREQINNYLLGHAGEEISPRELIVYVAGRYLRERFPYEYMVCLMVAVIEPERDRVRLANAGIHVLPLKALASGEVETLDCIGTPIGAAIDLDRMELDEIVLPFLPGEALFLTTDGLAEERRGGTFFGLDPIRSALSGGESAERMAEEILGSFEAFAGQRRGQDDLTFLLARRIREERGEDEK